MSFVLEARGLAKRFGQLAVLKELSLSVKRGEVYGFLGRNGSGKSTALRIAMGISKPSRGEVRLFGQRMGARTHVRLRQRVGYVAQEQHFYPWMHARALGDFVGSFHPSWDPALYADLIERLDVPPKRSTAQLSGGMRVKLALALALAHRPELLILDEPTAGLDPVARREFLQLVREQADRDAVTTLFSTHLIDEVEMAADRLGIVEGGRMRFEGTVDQLTAPYFRLVGPPGADAAPGAALESQGVEVLSDQRRGTRRQLLLRVADPDTAEAFAGLDPAWALEKPSLEDIFVEVVRNPR